MRLESSSTVPLEPAGAARTFATASHGVAPLFESVMLGGFECSCHRLEDGRRLDMTATTRHDALAEADYARLRSAGMAAARDGAPWVRMDRGGRYCFDPVAPLLRAATRRRVQVIWDLMHFGWPDELDPFDASFPTRFGAYAGAFARWLCRESDGVPMIAPVNEMSFLAWAGGDVRCINPFEAARGVELKAQLVRATIEAIEAVRAACPRARFVQPEPLIHIVADPEHPRTHRRIESDELLQYQAWDMLAGRVWPSLGGREDYLDVLGVNFYPDNQFTLLGATVARGDLRYRPLSQMLLDVWRRYRRPMFVSETGSEGDARAPWLRYVASQCIAAMAQGCELHGITLYPVLSHPGWSDGRHCQNGLWDYADDAGHRPTHEPLMAELRAQTGPLAAARAKMLETRRAAAGASLVNA